MTCPVSDGRDATAERPAGDTGAPVAGKRSTCQLLFYFFRAVPSTRGFSKKLGNPLKHHSLAEYRTEEKETCLAAAIFFLPV